MSNGAHLGASIQRVNIWRGQLDEGGEKGWSDIFMRDRFHDDALTPERRAWFAAQQEKWPRASILNALGVLIGADLTPRLKDIACPVLLLHPDGSPFIPVAVAAELHRRLPNAELNVFGHARHGLPFSHARPCATLVRKRSRRMLANGIGTCRSAPAASARPMSLAPSVSLKPGGLKARSRMKRP